MSEPMYTTPPAPPIPDAPPTAGPVGIAPPPPGGRPLPPVVLPEKDWDHMTLNWDQYEGQWKKSENGKYYELRFVYYATNVTSKAHQYMNIFVPAEYLNEDGSLSETGTCHGYTAKTAPIIFQNECVGWMSSTPGNANEALLENGFIYIHTGARSRDLSGIGKAPAPCVDQKAAIRFLRLHDAELPGDKEKIISRGVSGGGQMSSILGATGNMAAYYPWLFEMGAAGIEKDDQGAYISTINDHIFASQCYCPIADLDNADLAYAWMRHDDPNLMVSALFAPPTELSPFQQALQKDLSQAYCSYVNSLGLKNEQGDPLRFERQANGSFDTRRGSFYDQILRNISAALNAWLKDKTQSDGSLYFQQELDPVTKIELSFPSTDAYLGSLKDTEQWLVKDASGSYRVTDLAGFCAGTALKRGKDVPGFDAFHLTAENNAFGQSDETAAHFSASVAAVLKANYDRYKVLPGFDTCDVDAYIQHGQRDDLKEQAYLMNATHILLDNAHGRQKSDFAHFWRTRNGTADEHTSFTVAYNLCMAAKMAGAEVDYALVWNFPHGDADGDGTGTFVEWVHKIVK